MNSVSFAGGSHHTHSTTKPNLTLDIPEQPAVGLSRFSEDEGDRFTPKRSASFVLEPPTPTEEEDRVKKLLFDDEVPAMGDKTEADMEDEAVGAEVSRLTREMSTARLHSPASDKSDSEGIDYVRGLKPTKMEEALEKLKIPAPKRRDSLAAKALPEEPSPKKEKKSSLFLQA